MNKIKETTNYILTVESVSEEKPSDVIYRIINKKYGVVEVEVTMLPQAIKFLHDLEAGLSAVEDMYNAKEPVELKVYPGKHKS